MVEDNVVDARWSKLMDSSLGLHVLLSLLLLFIMSSSDEVGDVDTDDGCI